MYRNNKNLKSGMSVAIMLGCMAIIASVFGYFVCSWFLDYVTAPEEGVESVSTEQIVTEERVDATKDDTTEKEASSTSAIGKDQQEDTVVDETMGENLYVVQVGAFDKKDNAQNLVSQLKNEGFTAYITSKNPYRVQVGAFRTKDAADELGMELEKNDFPVYIRH